MKYINAGYTIIKLARTRWRAKEREKMTVARVAETIDARVRTYTRGVLFRTYINDACLKPPCKALYSGRGAASVDLLRNRFRGSALRERCAAQPRNGLYVLSSTSFFPARVRAIDLVEFLYFSPAPPETESAYTRGQ